MNDLTSGLLENKVKRVERQLRVYEGLLAAFLVALLATAWLSLRSTTAKADDSARVLRVRGLIVEDQMGRPRILLGAPITTVEGRKDQADIYGMIVVGENGVDRVIVCYPLPGAGRKGEAAGGVLLNDARGGERGGYVADDNGEVVLTLDGTRDEAIKLGVDPTKPMSWIAINGFDDVRPRILIALRDERPAQFVVLNPTGPDKQEVRVLHLNDTNSTRLILPRGAGRSAILDAVDKLEK